MFISYRHILETNITAVGELQIYWNHINLSGTTGCGLFRQQYCCVGDVLISFDLVKSIVLSGRSTTNAKSIWIIWGVEIYLCLMVCGIQKWTNNRYYICFYMIAEENYLKNPSTIFESMANISYNRVLPLLSISKSYNDGKN